MVVRGGYYLSSDVADTTPTLSTFLDAVAGAPPPSSDEEGIRVLRVLDSCQRVIDSGGRVELGS